MTTETPATTAGSFLEPEIGQLTGYIWQSTLDLTVEPIDSFPPALAGQPTIDGLINITGDWCGVVVLQLPQALASRVAGIMFKLGTGTPTLDDVYDALGEITNQIGGNLKGLLSGRCHLSLPAVVQGTDYAVRVPGTGVVTRVVFACDDSAFVVTLLASSQA